MKNKNKYKAGDKIYFTDFDHIRIITGTINNINPTMSIHKYEIKNSINLFIACCEYEETDGYIKKLHLVNNDDIFYNVEDLKLKYPQASVKTTIKDIQYKRYKFIDFIYSYLESEIIIKDLHSDLFDFYKSDKARHGDYILCYNRYTEKYINFELPNVYWEIKNNERVGSIIDNSRGSTTLLYYNKDHYMILAPKNIYDMLKYNYENNIEIPKDSLQYIIKIRI